MLVVVAGTYSSGKSTLVSDLANDFPTSVMVRDQCRPILDSYEEVDWTAPDLRTYLIMRQLLVEKMATKAAPLAFVDGGVINNLAHDRVLLKPPPDRTAAISSLGMSLYDLVFVTDPRDVPIRDDGQRYTNPAMRRRLHDTVLEAISDLGLKAIVVSGNREARLSFARGLILDGR